MRRRPQPWKKPRDHGNHFGPEERERVRDGFREGLAAHVLAERLGCSIRTICKHYEHLRDEGERFGVGARAPRAPIGAGRFYRSSFEPS